MLQTLFEVLAAFLNVSEHTITSMEHSLTLVRFAYSKLCCEYFKHRLLLLSLCC